MQDIPTDTESRAPSSRVLQEVIRQAPAEYVTVGWLTSALHRYSRRAAPPPRSRIG